MCVCVYAIPYHTTSLCLYRSVKKDKYSDSIAASRLLNKDPTRIERRESISLFPYITLTMQFISRIDRAREQVLMIFWISIAGTQRPWVWAWVLLDDQSDWVSVYSTYVRSIGTKLPRASSIVSMSYTLSIGIVSASDKIHISFCCISHFPPSPLRFSSISHAPTYIHTYTHPLYPHLLLQLPESLYKSSTLTINTQPIHPKTKTKIRPSQFLPLFDSSLQRNS